MKCFAIIGKIASGKSFIGNMLRKNYKVIDMDDLSKELIKKGTICFQKIVEYFGSSILKKNFDLNKKKLRNIVFSDYKKLLELEMIMHPIMRKLFFLKLKKEKKLGRRFIFFELSFFLNKDMEFVFDKIIFIHAFKYIRLKRIMMRDGGSFDHAKKIINLQYIAKKNRFNYDYLLNNSYNSIFLLKELKKICSKIVGNELLLGKN
jgi:dephospho-CoA kinase